MISVMKVILKCGVSGSCIKRLRFEMQNNPWGMNASFRLILVLFLTLAGCKQKHPHQTANPDIIHRLNLALMEAVVQDGFSPPVSSRVYAYPNIAAYEAVIHGDTNFISYAGQLGGLNELPQPYPQQTYSREVVMVKSFCDVARAMVYRDFIIDEAEAALLDSLRKENDGRTFAASVAFGKKLGEAVIQWAGSDNYIQTRNMPKFMVTDTPGSWLPTPPKYLEALEPHWFKVRPFALDSAGQFREPLWYRFSTDSASDFYKRVKEVYDLTNRLTDEQIQIARFWDDNPSPLKVEGHVVTTSRQNTPGGHWLGIARIAAKKNNLSLAETCEVLSKTAIAIADAFKVIWDTKYACNNVRPVTYIGKYIDANWSPILETPNFPEFSSGHSGISAAAAYVLTQHFGESFAFTDSTNIPFGYPARKFSSFREAADEAAMSRVYGGIHYIPSCKIGAEQGRKTGEVVAVKLRTRRVL